MYICVNSTIQRCPNKIVKIFLIEDFSHLPPVTLSCEYLREFSKKFETVVMVYSEAGGKQIDEKTRREKSRDTVPLKPRSQTLFPAHDKKCGRLGNST